MTPAARAWRGLAALVLALLAMPAWAERHALLVGVGQYPQLAPELQLKAPAQDVRLMREVLLQRGFDAARIEVLADGVDGARLPTRAAIVDALTALAARVRPGDTVMLHFAGHGSLQRVAAAGEPPAWQPVFLPRDVRRWDGQAGAAVPNALTDDDLRARVDRLNDAGAFVFALFDACHSARLVRGAPPVAGAAPLRQRHVPPQALGQPGEPPDEVGPPWVTASPARPTGPATRGRAVYFYAAQSVELAAAMPQVQGGEPVWHGLLGWHVAQALALGLPMSHRQLGQHVLARHDRLPAAAATPLFGGDGLDDPVFGDRASRVRQWAIDRAGNRLELGAGALQGLADGALFALLADPLAPAAPSPTQAPQGTLGFVRLAQLQAQRARLEPVAWQGLPAPSAAALPAGSWARLMVNPPAYAVRAVLERSACRGPCVAERALARLQRDGAPGVDLRWVDAGELPDLQLQATDRGVRLRMPGQAEGGPPDLGVALPAGDAALQLDALAQLVAEGVHRLARSRNLLRLAARQALQDPAAAAGVQLVPRLHRQGAEPGISITPERVTDARPGDTLVVEGVNAGRDPVDLAVFWLDAAHGVRLVHPQDRRDSARLAAGERLRRFGLRIDPGSRGTERLLVIALPMRPGREAADFRLLEQAPLERLRAAADPDLQALLDACFADHQRRGEVAPALPADGLRMQLFTFEVRP